MIDQLIIAIGNDHAGTELKNKITKHFQSVTWLNKGTNTQDSVDYPDFAHPVAEAVETDDAHLGILICGSGNGVCMSANKHQKIRAALCWNKEIVALARNHNNANILCLPARFISEEEALEMVQLFLKETFDGGRHEKRVNKI